MHKKQDVEGLPYICPVCRSDAYTITRTYRTEDLRHNWQTLFNIDITGELPNAPEISLCSCARCTLQYYTPAQAGSENLYRQLQVFDWYYMPDKWEFRYALQDIQADANVLEIGCGQGDFISRLIQRGTTAAGIEFNETAVAAARKKGLPVTAVSLAEMARTHKLSFDNICCFQVLEHVTDPFSILSNAIELLKPGGALIISVPNGSSYLKDMTCFLDMPPHHITRWNRECFAYIPRLLPLKIKSLKNEPLAPYHVDEYIAVTRGKKRKSLLEKLICFPRHDRYASFILKNTPANRFITGHTLYVHFIKTG